LNLDQYMKLLEPDERHWLQRLSGHAEDTGHSLEVILAEALIDRHREALDLTEANDHLTTTVTKLRAAQVSPA
jgi:hypothetical protein